MAKAFLHINGVDYELAATYDDAGRFERYVKTLKPQEVNPERDVNDRLAPEYGGTGGPSRWIDVRRGAEVLRLEIRLDRVWSVGGWVEAE